MLIFFCSLLSLALSFSPFSIFLLLSPTFSSATFNCDCWMNDVYLRYVRILVYLNCLKLRRFSPFFSTFFLFKSVKVAGKTIRFCWEICCCSYINQAKKISFIAIMGVIVEFFFTAERRSIKACKFIWCSFKTNEIKTMSLSL